MDTKKSRVLVFLRHGKTGSAANDLARRLTDDGVRQAEVRRDALGNTRFDLVVASSADRAISTVAIVAGIDMEQVLGMEELYLGTDFEDKAELTRLFGQLRYASLRTYREADTKKH